MKTIDLTKAKKSTHNIIARGETSGHSHIAIGAVDVLSLNEETYLHVYGEAVIKHLLEESFVRDGVEIWTREHNDIQLEPGIYKYVPQIEFDPYDELIRKVLD